MTDAVAPAPQAAVVAVAATREVLDHPELDESLLRPWELRRLTAIRVPSRRDDVVAARLLVRLCAARFTGRAPCDTVLDQHCPDCGGFGHGRPSLRTHPGVGLSYSHADGRVAAAAGPGPIGVDVEPADRRPGPVPVLARLLPEAEVRAAAGLADPGPALLRLWVRHEALLKAGDGTLPVRDWTDPPCRAVVAVAAAGPLRTLTTGPARPAGERIGGGGPGPTAVSDPW
ncbi:4'-phosphopantetheinyl transferase superfamily protein [Streptomyces sp. RKAG290]|uniref:4'-phosphopantetheinyl transferase family protein n=1 Tax=Streptomyces sp. RKAG290 TaxID=2888348 RepID=UPI002033A248|nr:4'-phosphopantetheinyl transferase superfamily protein [Streptomyces sp. RKAG290]MCM2415978.1 4'-phosphopantetheinyl transferase superfamily protein [Streptomyces sp. RKAG290]